MGSTGKILERILRGQSDANIAFRDVRNLLLHLGFEERISGGHHIFRKEGIRQMINLQKDGSRAKPYQIRQVRHIILEYKLAGEV
ncbi:MAG: hypothetical protein IT446_08410 [Phycisphaerales bacterium]|jgi:hypothetical protein|nr:hypothetical protein [Phycisphaerales bacterium]